MSKSQEMTFGILKPDVVEENMIGQIIAMIEQTGLEVSGMFKRVLFREEVEELYAEHEGKPFYRKLVNFMLSGPVVCLAVEGEDAVARYRTLVKEVIRPLYETTTTRNAAHASDGPEAAAREMDLFFENDEESPDEE